MLQLQQRCEPEILQNLRAALLKVDNEVFQYDRKYIMDTMGWDDTPQEPRIQESALAGEAHFRQSLACNDLFMKTCIAGLVYLKAEACVVASVSRFGPP